MTGPGYGEISLGLAALYLGLRIIEHLVRRRSKLIQRLRRENEGSGPS